MLAALLEDSGLGSRPMFADVACSFAIDSSLGILLAIDSGLGIRFFPGSRLAIDSGIGILAIDSGIGILLSIASSLGNLPMDSGLGILAGVVVIGSKLGIFTFCGSFLLAMDSNLRIMFCGR